VKVHVDQRRCVGSGQCARTVPEVFDQRDEDGIVVLRTTQPDGRLAPAVRKAARHCPAQAIRIEEP
jgi:ferredoxin